MKKLLIAVLFLVGCQGQIVFGHDRLVYKAFNGHLSCLQLRCCFPYSEHGERLIICNQGISDGDSVFIRYYR